MKRIIGIYIFLWIFKRYLHVDFCFSPVGHGMVGGVIGNNNNNNNNMNQPPLPSCTRILAMNMIGDLMRKVGVSAFLL